MASWNFTFQQTKGGKTATSSASSLGWATRAGLAIVRINHLILAALVALIVPGSALFGQSIAIATTVGIVGLMGMQLAARHMVIGSSLTLLSIIVWGKIATNILKTTAPDTALLLATFTAIIVLMEGSLVVLAFTEEQSKLKARYDELSEALKQQQEAWLRNQLSSQTKFTLVALALSVALVPVAGLTSISNTQLAFSGTLALFAVILLLFLIVHRREPETD